MKEVSSREEQLLATALYRVNDVVVTNGTVKVRDSRGADAGGALPGWLWVVDEVFVEQTGCGVALRYAVVAKSAPLMYSAVLLPKQIARKVGGK